MRRLLLPVLLALVMLSACPRNGGPVDPLDAMLRVADVAWERRGTDGLDAAELALNPAWELGRDDTRVRWRMARIQTANGMVASDAVVAQRLYSSARGHGISCLDTVPGFASARRQGEWSEAVGRAEDSQPDCLAWTGLAWTRWRQVVGVAGAIDDDAILQYVGALPSDRLGLQAWSVAIADSLYDFDSAETSFAEAIRVSPGDLVRRVDRLLWVRGVRDPSLLQRRGAQLVSRIADVPEEQGAIGRLQRAMRLGSARNASGVDTN